jgi:hypothetical protein
MEALDADKPHFPAVSDPLRAISEQIEQEMNSCVLPMLDDTTLDDLKPFSASALRHLPTLAPLLDLEPTPEVAQFSKDQPVARVGTHRAAVAELMAQLFRAECPAVVQALGATGMLKPIVTLALDRPTCSAIQCAALRCLRATVAPSCGHLEVWKPLILENNGEIPSKIAGIASAAHGVSIGLRPPHTGFAVAVGEVLCTAARGKSPGGVPTVPSSPVNEEGASSVEGEEEQLGKIEEVVEEGEKSEGEEKTAAAEEEAKKEEEKEEQEKQPPRPPSPPIILAPWQTSLSSSLDAIPTWPAFVSEEGPLALHLTAQQMDLAGPRPQRHIPQTDMDAELAALSGNGQMISGQELLALLRGLSFGRMS